MRSSRYYDLIEHSLLVLVSVTSVAMPYRISYCYPICGLSIDSINIESLVADTSYLGVSW